MRQMLTESLLVALLGMSASLLPDQRQPAWWLVGGTLVVRA